MKQQLFSRFFLFFVGIFLTLSTVANVKINFQSKDNLIIYGGKCYKVLEYLRDSNKSDSIAVVYFLENFDILDNRNPKFKKGVSPNVVINYFNKEDNKDLICKHKHLKMDNVLLDTLGYKKEFPY